MEQDRTEKPRMLICGLGSIGRRHLRNFKALGVKDIILLRSGKGTLPDDDLKGFPVEYELEQALERYKPDAVVVSNPTSMHVATAAAALDAGCHVLLEKPVSDSLDAALSLLEAEQNSPGRVLVGFQFRFHPGLQRIRKLITEGVIGDPISVIAHWGEYLPDWHPWEDYRMSYSARRDLGGGVVNTLSHPVDYLRMLFGDVKHVTASLTNSGGLDIDVEDTATMLLAFINGVHGVVHVNYVQRPPRHALEIVGERGTLRWENASGMARWWSAGEDRWSEAKPPVGFERNHLFLEETRHMLDIIAGREEPCCSLLDGIRALEITHAAHESQHEGARATVKLHACEGETLS